MNIKKVGEFIAEQRKMNNMTQKDLAVQLKVTDKAVSKWERGLSCPDTSLLLQISDIFGITVNELLRGEKSNSREKGEHIQVATSNPEHERKEKTTHFARLGAIIFSVLCIISIVVCMICDFAITGRFTWSLFQIVSVVFGWLVFYPLIRFGLNRINIFLWSISIFTVPFLWLLQQLIDNNNLINSIGFRVFPVGMVFMWVIYILFYKIDLRKLFAAALAFTLAIPVGILVNVVIRTVISEPLIDVWDVLWYSIAIVLAIIFYCLDYMSNRRELC